jgi:hypothetical protein
MPVVHSIPVLPGLNYGPDLISDLGLDTRGLSPISASFFYTLAIMQIPISMYLDAIGPRMAMPVLSLLGVSGAHWFSPGENRSVPWSPGDLLLYS